MKVEMVSGPFILQETVDMLYKYVNGISFRALMSHRRSRENAEIAGTSIRRLDQLQRIMEDACLGLDAHAPELRYFFQNIETENKDEDVCLARFLIGSFCTLTESGFDAQIRQIKELWAEIQARGGWIQGYCLGGLSFSFSPDSPGDLLEQICALPLPSDFQLQMFRSFRSFDQTLDTLAALIRPVAVRLEEKLQKGLWILRDMESYWKKAPMDPLEFLSKTVGTETLANATGTTKMAISLMNCNVVLHNMEAFPYAFTGFHYIYMGCDITLESVPVSSESDYENVGSVLKALGDKKRLEILNRLAHGRSYCHELAEVMGADPGNMSRNLTMLYNMGFLRQERDAQKYYYETDPEAVREFLGKVESILLS